MQKYDKAGVSERYDKARPLPAETLELWLRAISDSIDVGRVENVVDVGCGTGRFSRGLAEWFNAEVVGVDPSTSMLSQAIAKESGGAVSYCQGSAERIPIPDKSTDLVFLSMAYHHIENIQAAICEFGRVLRDGGVVCVRNSTTDLIDSIPYIRHFPSAREYGLKKYPRRADMIKAMASAGLVLVKHATLEQQFAASPAEYLEKIRMRGLSDLAAMDDGEFNSGVVRLEASLVDASGPVKEPVDLLIFENRPG